MAIQQTVNLYDLGSSPRGGARAQLSVSLSRLVGLAGKSGF
jgi:hypothetical protein